MNLQKLHNKRFLCESTLQYLCVSQDSDGARIFPSIESYPLFTYFGYKCAPNSVEVKF